jgi:hypothetical protein
LIPIEGGKTQEGGRGLNCVLGFLKSISKTKR